MTEIMMLGCTSFAMGADVPEWLIVAEPKGEGAVKGRLRFGVDAMVIEHPDFYMLWPAGELGVTSAPLIDAHGYVNCNFIGASKPVKHPLSWLTFKTEADSTMEAPPGAIVPAQVAAMEDAHRRQMAEQAKAAYEAEVRRQRDNAMNGVWPPQYDPPMVAGRGYPSPTYLAGAHPPMQRSGLLTRLWRALF